MSAFKQRVKLFTDKLLNEFVIPYTSCARSVRVGPSLFSGLTRQLDGVNSTHQVEKRFTAKVAETELADRETEGRAEAESRGDTQQP